MEDRTILRKLNRRCILAATAGILASRNIHAAHASGTAINTEWQIFKSRFLLPDGRIIDTGNGGISHSEGQGWGMLFAEAAGDKDSFDLIYAWTSTYLARADDSLHIWRYNPAMPNPTADKNNATDGDIFIAWALTRGAQSWQQPALTAAAAAIATDIRDKLCIQQSGQIFLLPGISGFVSSETITLNPSYYVFPAFSTLASLAPSGIWAKLHGDGLNMLQNAVFGAWRLPPDWLSVSLPALNLSPAPAWPPRFGFDAIRVPLWLDWSNQMPPQLRQAFSAYWQSSSFSSHPAWIDLQTGAYANFAAPAGMAAIESLTLAALSNTQPALPSVAAASDYYSAALILLCHLASGN